MCLHNSRKHSSPLNVCPDAKSCTAISPKGSGPVEGVSVEPWNRSERIALLGLIASLVVAGDPGTELLDRFKRRALSLGKEFCRGIRAEDRHFPPAARNV